MSINPITQKPYSKGYLDARPAIEKLPMMKESVKKELHRALKNSDLILLSAETGSGKSLLTPFFAWEYLGWDKYVVCSQPRTVNASTIADGVARIVADVPMGEQVGYRYKHNNKTGLSTRLVYTTDGTLLSQCFKQPDFSPYSCVVIDEAHERNMNIDLILFFIREYLQRKEHTVKFIIMSATAQMDPIKEYFKGVAISEIFAAGRTFPVRQHFLDKSVNGKYMRPIIDRLVSIVNDEIYPKLQTSKEQSDILVFLPSKRDVDQLCMLINDKEAKKFRLKCVGLPLYSGLDKSQELLAVDETKFKSLPGMPEVKIVCSTNIAETGVTVKSISYVVDSGYEYESTFDPVKRESILVQRFIPKSSVTQRMGRAGRTKPGVCYHMYTRAEYDGFDDYKHAEITTGNIDNVLLKMLHYGQGVVDGGRATNILSRLIEPPSRPRVDSTFQYLKELGVLDASGNITGTGLCVYRLNMDVPVALFLIGCRKHAVDKQKALTLAAIMLVDRSYQGWFRPPMRTLPDYSEQMKKYETLQSKYTSDVSELLALYELYEDFANDRLSRWKKWINVKHLSEVPKTVRQIEKNYNSMEEKCMEELPKASPGGKFLVPKTPAETIVQCLLYGFKNQIAVLKSKQKPIYKFEVMGETIEVAPEEGNGLSEFTTRVIYFDLSNILGRRQLSGLTNIADD